MISEKLQKAINEQITAEMWSSNLYLAMSFYFEKEGFSGFAHWMKKQSQEEMAHAYAMADYIIKRGGTAKVDKIDIDYIEYLKENYKYSVAIGEIGLDYHYTKENKEKQIKLLKSQLSFATKYNLPVIIHARECINDIYNILKEYNLKGVIHAYSGSYEMAREFIKLGYKIGIGGVITFKNSNLKEVVRRIDIKDIVLETDSPYLTPEPNRGKKNNPLYLKYIIDTIANVKNMTYESVVNITTQTAISLFDLNS